MKGVKFRLVLDTTTKKGNKVELKYNVPPSKHLGLINFLKIALEHGNEVSFNVEKITKGKRELSRAKGSFKLKEESKDQSILSEDKKQS
jgi:hypothetical protein